jgi:hypothetical protein
MCGSIKLIMTDSFVKKDREFMLMPKKKELLGSHI